uniref:p2C59 n=1 Tax=Arundo donax TaxID=35708 RepID=A0A0A8YAM3_ARUDO
MDAKLQHQLKKATEIGISSGFFLLTSLVTTSQSPSLARMRNSRELSTTSSCLQTSVLHVKSHSNLVWFPDRIYLVPFEFIK